MKISRIIVVMAAVGCLLVSSAWAQNQQTQDQQMKAYIDMMRKDIRIERQAYVDQAITRKILHDAEEAAGSGVQVDIRRFAGAAG